MIIRTAQLEAFQKAIQKDFPRRLVTIFSDQDEGAESDPQLLEQCRRLAERAPRYGLRTEFEIATFVACGVELGDDFDARAELPYRSILQHPSLAPRLKAAQLLELFEESEGPEEED